MGACRQTEIEYDNRFGFSENCTALWTFDSTRVGEQFIFRFPNGIKVSVIRFTTWSYVDAAMGNVWTSSYGFSAGQYEALVKDKEQNQIEEAGFMNYKEVHELLKRWSDYDSSSSHE